MTVAADTQAVPMQVAKVAAVGRAGGDGISHFAVLEELGGERHLLILIGPFEAFGLAAGLDGVTWGRPMTYQFMAGLVRGFGGRVREVRLDRVIEGAYAATVILDGPAGAGQVDARSSDALNLAVLLGAPVFVAPEMLADCARRQESDSAEAATMRLALDAAPMAIQRADPG